MTKSLLAIVVPAFVLAAIATGSAAAQASRMTGFTSRAYDVAASGDRDRNKDDDESEQGQFGPRNSSRGATTNDDDDAPRALRHPEDQQLRDRIDRGEYQERDLDRLRGRNYRD